MEFISRLHGAWYCLVRGYIAMPAQNFKVIMVADEHLIFTNNKDMNSLSVANWALSRAPHYWKATALGQSVVEQVELLEVETSQDD